MKIWYIPIEPYEERYTEQWYRWWKEAFESLGQEYEYVEGEPVSKKIDTGSVLDCYGTSRYKSTQITRLVDILSSGKIQDGDTIFFADLWFPGIETLQYIRDISGKKFKIAGILHAGTWDRNDFTCKAGMRNWAKHVEAGWLQFVDAVFVATDYHERMIVEKTLGVNRDKIHVTGLPFNFLDVYYSIVDEGDPRNEKEDIVVFPHRTDDEKQPWLFDKLAYDLRKTGWRFVKSKDVTNTKSEYYNLLEKSKIAVSFAKQETFGYAMLESLVFNCIPVVPNRLSYKEMPCYEYKYSTYQDAKNVISSLIKNKTESNDDFRETAKKEYFPSAVIKKMIEKL